MHHHPLIHYYFENKHVAFSSHPSLEYTAAFCFIVFNRVSFRTRRNTEFGFLRLN